MMDRERGEGNAVLERVGEKMLLKWKWRGRWGFNGFLLFSRGIDVLHSPHPIIYCQDMK